MSNFKLSHGEAVKSGLKFIVELSVKKGYMSPKTGEKCLEFLIKRGVKDFEYSREELAEVSKCDKKRKGGHVELVLLKDIGEPFIEKVKTEKLGEYYGN